MRHCTRMTAAAALAWLPAALLLAAAGAAPAAAANSEDGGSGLLRVDYAWSMPFRGLVVSTHAGYFSNEFTPGTARYMTLTPSLTKGLSNGFEAAVALPFEILTDRLEDAAFDRRFDLRQRDLLAKLRWSGPLAGPRLRLGLQGMLGAPLFSDGMRPGGDRDPGTALDAGAMALLSANVGAFSFPVRIHANAGYWWSRDDGAVYTRQLPSPLPLAGAGIEHNDLVLGGLAVEAGLRRFVLFTELTTEQLVGARAQVRGRENLWRLTPGVRTDVGQNISLTAGLSFDLSSDDPATAYNPKDAYPDVELRVGLMLGTVLTRQRYEARKQRDQMNWAISGRAERAEPADVVQAEATPPAIVPPAAVAPVAPPATRTPAADPGAAPLADLRQMEERLARLELQMRMAQLEARVLEFERRESSPAAASAWPARERIEPDEAADVEASWPAAETATPAEPVAVQQQPAGIAPDATAQRLAAMQRQLDALARAVAAPRAPAVAPAPVATAPAAAPAAAAPTGATVTPAERAAPRAVAPALPPVVVTPAARGESAPAEATVAAPAPALEPSTDPETEALWDEIDRLSAELLGETAGAAAAPPETPIESTAAGEAPVATPFPLAVGERVVLTEVDLLAADPLANDAARQSLDAWAALLAADPQVQVALLVHAGGVDREEGLGRTTEQAARLRDYLALAGVDAAQMVALGMGAAEPLVGAEVEGAARINTRLEIERLR